MSPCCVLLCARARARTHGNLNCACARSTTYENKKMRVSMDLEQVSPPVPPGSDEAPATHQPNDVVATGNILATIFDEEQSSEYDAPFAGGPGEDEASVDPDAISNAETSTGIPKLVAGELAGVSPDDASFDFNTMVYKRTKLMSLQFDERGKARVLAWCVVRINPSSPPSTTH